MMGYRVVQRFCLAQNHRIEPMRPPCSPPCQQKFLVDLACLFVCGCLRLVISVNRGPHPQRRKDRTVFVECDRGRKWIQPFPITIPRAVPTGAVLLLRGLVRGCPEREAEVWDFELGYF